MSIFVNDTINIETSLKGLGTNITFLSMLVHSGMPVHITTKYHEYRWLMLMKEAFNLTNITVTEKETLTNDQCTGIGDLSKLFSPYFTADTINLNGNVFPVNGRKKPCIGFACYGDTNNVFDREDFEKGDKGWPRNRWYHIEDWAKIFQYVKMAGYDIITFDSKTIDTGTKMYLLNELCDAVVGYEGGVAHLSHLLKVPVLMLPWHHPTSVIPGLDILEEEKDWAHFIHLDPRTYFLKSVDELLGWSHNTFKDVINNLKDGGGNNKLLNSEFIMVKSNLLEFRIEGRADRVMPYRTAITPLEKEIINRTHKNIQFGGQVPVIFVNEFN